MEEKAEFTKIDRSDKRMYGPRGLLVCGYPLEERESFLEFVKNTLDEITVIFGVNTDINSTLGEIFNHDHKAGMTDPSDLPRAVIMSGLSQNELHGLMGAYRSEGFVKQLWATLTPVSENWTLKSLLIELLNEAEAMRKKK
jgi:hypothetical protein